MNNPQAFPNPSSRISNGNPVQHGMTLRDYFAAAAMQGMCAWGNDDTNYDHSQIPHWAYQIADAMLAEREKQS